MSYLIPAAELGGGEPATPRGRAAPGRAARRATPRPGQPPGQQLSLFGVEAAPPVPADLEGLLAGPGQVARMGGTARVSVVVADLWRARRLHAELALRGIAATLVATAGDTIRVRTAYSTQLAPLGVAWLRGTVKHPPQGFGLDGRRLRLWVLAAGHGDQLGFTLPLGTFDEPAWEPVGVALSAAGLPAVLLGNGAGGPAYRISGRRRLARLAELIGDPPAEAPPDAWPAA